MSFFNRSVATILSCVCCVWIGVSTVCYSF